MSKDWTVGPLLIGPWLVSLPFFSCLRALQGLAKSVATNTVERQRNNPVGTSEHTTVDVAPGAVFELPRRWPQRQVGPDVSKLSDASAEISRRERRYRIALVTADLSAAGLSTAVFLPTVGDTRARVTDLLWLLPAMAVTAKVLGLYARDHLVLRQSTLDEMPALVNLTTAFVLLLCVVREGAHAGMPSAATLVALWIVTIFTVGGTREAARRIAARLSPIERCVLLGEAGALARLRARVLDQRRVSVVGSMGFVAALNDDALFRLVTDRSAHRIVVVPDASLRAADAFDVVRAAKATGRRVSVASEILDAVGTSAVCDDIGGLTLLGMPRFGMNRFSALIKRAFDLSAASVLVLAVTPLLAVLSVLIRVDTPGPVLFRQTRIGRDGRPFEMLKLRTMVDGADALKPALRAFNEAADGLFKITADPRITRVGRLLRQTNLDELPQLINVLRGEMSLVGPRPLVVEEDERICGLDRRRLVLTPGMTGPWQTTGSTRAAMADMVKLDYLYVANWSLWGDVKILLRTVPYVVQRRGQ